MRLIRLTFIAIFIFTLSIVSPSAYAAAPELISRAQYPTGVAVDSSGNIYIAAQNNKFEPANRGLIVIPKVSGTLFGQQVTAGQAKVLDSNVYIVGIAISSNDDVYYTDKDGNISVITKSSTPIFGVPVVANQSNLLFSGTNFRGTMEFDSSGNLFGIVKGDYGPGTLSVISKNSPSLYGVDVAANTPTTLLTDETYWFWDFAIDNDDNILISNGFSKGVLAIAKNAGTYYEQSLSTASPPVAVALTAFNSIFANEPPSGIDVDSAGNVFVAQYGTVTFVYSPQGGQFFGQTVQPKTLTKLSATASGRTSQGLAVTPTGDLVLGGGIGVFYISNEFNEPAVQELRFAKTDRIYTANFQKESNQNLASWGEVNPKTSELTKFNQLVPDATEGGGYDSVTNKNWIMGADCKFYSLDESDNSAPVEEFTFNPGYSTACWGLATLNNGTALVTTYFDDPNDNSDAYFSKIEALDLRTGSSDLSNPLNSLSLDSVPTAIAINSKNEIWVYDWNTSCLGTVNKTDGKLENTIPIFEYSGDEIWSMDFDSEDNLIATSYYSGDGILSMRPGDSNPLSTIIKNETKNRYGWMSDAIWVRKNVIADNSESQNQTQTASASALKDVAKTVSTSAFKFGKGASYLTGKNQKQLLADKASYLGAAKVKIYASAGCVKGISKKRVERLALKRANAIKKFLIENGVAESKIEIELNVVKFGLTPKSNLLYTI